MQKALAILFFIINFDFFCFGQQVSKNVDEIFKKAQSLAFSNHFKEARETAQIVLNINQKYYDAYVLIGRTYAWEHQYDSARVEIKKVLMADSSYRDAIDALIDIEFWSGNITNALTFSDLALKYYPDDKDFLLKKAKILMALGKDEEAQAVLSILLNLNKNSFEVNTLMASLKKYHNQVNVEHTFDFYRVPYLWRWNVTSLQYQLNSKSGVFIGKFNVGQLVQDGQYYLSNPNEQLEIDAYPILNPHSYVYMNYGYSWCPFFPLHRVGIEPYNIFKNDWEASGGFRFLVFKDIPSYSYITILTGSVGKYFSSNWVSFRPYVTFSANQPVAFSSFLFYRHYLDIPDNYTGGEIGYGASPDDKYNDSGQFIHFNSKSYHVRYDIQHHINKRILFRFMSEFIYEAYLVNQFHNRFVNDLYLSYSF